MKQSPSLTWTDYAQQGLISGTKTFLEPTVFVIRAVKLVLDITAIAVVSVLTTMFHLI